MNQKLSFHVVVIGCGAIGSFLAILLARLLGVVHITLVDPGTYEASNLRSQNIFPCDVDELKVGGAGATAARRQP